MRELSFEGEPVITRVFAGEEIYRGPRAELGPDLVLLSRPGLDLKGTTKEREVFGDTHFQGMHTWEDAFVWSRLPVPEEPEIADLADVIVAWFSG